MRRLTGTILAGGLLVAAPFAAAQPREGDRPRGAASDDLVPRMLAFDKDGDGRLTRAEITDRRLLRLFDRADGDKDGTVTKEELAALQARERANERDGPPGFGPPGGPGGPMMGPPRPGDVLPPPLRRRLRLSEEQEAKLDALQKDVDARLDAILNDEQKAELKTIRERGPGGRGRPGGGPPPPRGERDR